MFNFFSKSNPQPLLSKEERVEIESFFERCIATFGLPFTTFGSSTLSIQLQESIDKVNLINGIATQMKLDKNDILIFESRYREELEWVRINEHDGPGKFDPDSKITITVEEYKELAPFDFIIDVARNIAYIQVQMTGYTVNDVSFESFVDYFIFYCGLGSIYVHADPLYNTDVVSKYLPDNHIAYAAALFYHITNTEPKLDKTKFPGGLQNKIYDCLNQLSKNGPDHLSSVIIKNALLLFALEQKRIQAENNKQIQEEIDVYKEMQSHNVLSLDHLHDWGYTLLQLKQYDDAILKFNEVIQKDAYYAIAFNNRGYGYLQKGNLEQGYRDISSSILLNGEASNFDKRNLGVYYYLTGAYETALKHFVEAFQIQEKTELIHFYLSLTYSRLGNNDAAHLHKQLHIESKNLNDSILTL